MHAGIFPSKHRTGHQRFAKAERLRSLRAIRELFAQGQRLTRPPLRIVFQIIPEPKDPPVQVLLAVPARKVRGAVDRSRIRRLMRETYRRAKHLLIARAQQTHKQVRLVFIFDAEPPSSYSAINTSIQWALQKICASL